MFVLPCRYQTELQQQQAHAEAAAVAAEAAARQTQEEWGLNRSSRDSSSGDRRELRQHSRRRRSRSGMLRGAQRRARQDRHSRAASPSPRQDDSGMGGASLASFSVASDSVTGGDTARTTQGSEGTRRPVKELTWSDQVVDNTIPVSPATTAGDQSPASPSPSAMHEAGGVGHSKSAPALGGHEEQPSTTDNEHGSGMAAQVEESPSTRPETHNDTTASEDANVGWSPLEVRTLLCGARSGHPDARSHRWCRLTSKRAIPSPRSTQGVTGHSRHRCRSCATRRASRSASGRCRSELLSRCRGRTTTATYVLHLTNCRRHTSRHRFQSVESCRYVFRSSTRVAGYCNSYICACTTQRSGLHGSALPERAWCEHWAPTHTR